MRKGGGLKIGKKKEKRGEKERNWEFWELEGNEEKEILGIRPKRPIGPVWACLGPIGPNWAQMDTPKCSLNTRHPTSVNCGNNLPKTVV